MPHRTYRVRRRAAGRAGPFEGEWLHMRSSKVLWTVQILLALLFSMAGAMKLVLPLDQMKGPVDIPGLLLRFVGAAEVLGAVALILPGALRLHENLVPLAAMGLTIVMLGAVGITVWGGPAVTAVIPLLVGLLTGYVAWGRMGRNQPRA